MSLASGACWPDCLNFLTCETERSSAVPVLLITVAWCKEVTGAKSLPWGLVLHEGCARTRYEHRRSERPQSDSMVAFVQFFTSALCSCRSGGPTWPVGDV